VSRRVRTFVKEWAPPAAVKLLRKLGGDRFAGMTFEGEFATWEDAVAASGGYDDPSILAKVANATQSVKRGDGAYERDSVLFTEVEYSWPVLSALMWGCALDGGRLSVLDFGGALGSTYFQHRTPLADLDQVRWGVVEQPHYVAEGKANFQDDQLRFYTTIEECVEAIRPNVILLGSALQYVARPDEILARLGLTDAGVMIVDRTPFADVDDDVITVQRVPPSIYRATYPFRILSRKRALDQLLATWRFIATIDAPEGEFTVNEALTFRFDGFILHR
jgi:putative methyltransferase (TIGR04325 family)